MENTFGINIIPDNDVQRVAVLKRYKILDTQPDDAFDNVARLAAQMFEVPVSLISLVDADQVFFKANIGAGDVRYVPRGISLCSLTVLNQQVTIFEDATQAEILSANPNVTDPAGVRFYAGAPLTTFDGYRIGSFCLSDYQPRKFTKADEAILQGLAKVVMDVIELRLAALAEADKIQDANEELSAINEEMSVINEEMSAANEELVQSRDSLQQINETLKESEDKFRNLVSQAPVAIAIYSGPNLLIAQANEAMLNMLGRGTEIIGMPLLKARPELLGHPYLEVIKEVLVTGKQHIGTATKAPVLINGELRDGYFDSTYKPVRDDKGEITGVMVVATDVTDKTMARQRELELNNEVASVNEELTASNEELMSSQEFLLQLNHNLTESESRFRGLIEQAPVAIATLKGRELVIDCVNDMILHIWGKDRSVVGKELHIALPELEGQPFLQILDDVYIGGQPFVGSEAEVMIEQNGLLTKLFVNFIYKPIKDVNGNTTDIMVVANDVTEQVNSRLILKQKNDELILLAEQLAYVSNTIPQQVWTATPDGALDFVNQQTIEYFGKEAVEIIGENWIKLVYPADLEAAGKAWMHSLKTGEPYQTEFRLLFKDGTYLWHLARATAFVEDGKIVKWFGTNTDIDGHKKLEQHKDDFISIASHELKTPITSLKASLQYLNRIKENPPADIIPKLIEQSNRGIQKISSLVDDLLSVSRMNVGQMHLQKNNFVTGDLFDTCCGHLMVEGKYELVFEGDLKTEVYADEHLIEQVIVNLVNNAVKYAPDSKTIRLNVKAMDKAVKISVIDKGQGVPPNKLPHLFDRYYRADHSGQQYSGLGLGLYICSEIIKRHDGEIGVESEIGKGSTFWFTLPR